VTADKQVGDITVIGGGIIGTCCALYLLQAGYRVAMIDPMDARGRASFGNAGVISPWSVTPQSLPGIWRKVPGWLARADGPLKVRRNYLHRFVPWALRFLAAGRQGNILATSDAMAALTRPNVALYRALLRGTGSEHLVQDACYVQVFRERGMIDPQAWGLRLRQRIAAPVEIIGDGALHELEPDLSPEYRAAILIRDQARTVSPSGLLDALRHIAADAGLHLISDRVRSVNPVAGAEWRVDGEQRIYRTGKVVIAGGAWSTRLLAPLGVRVPLIAERGYHLVMEDPGVTLNNSVMDVANMFVISSMQHGLHAAGTAEFARVDDIPDYRRAEIFAQLGKQLLPGLNTENRKPWMGSRPSMPDSLPCIGQVPGRQGLYVAFGHSHYGLGMAPATGRLVADIVRGVDPDIDTRPYRIDRFR